MNNQLNEKDVELIIPEIVDDPKRFGWIKDFVVSKRLPADCYALPGAKGKGGSFRCCIRLIYQLLVNNRSGVIIRNQYLGHYRTAREIRERIIPLIERTTGKKIGMWLEMPSERTHNFNARCIRNIKTNKAIYFLAYEDPQGFSNMSAIHEVFCEEFVKLSVSGDYNRYLELAEDNFIRIIDNFSRFDDKKEFTNIFFSFNPNDPDSWFCKAIYPDAIDFSDAKVSTELVENYSVIGKLPNYCGRSWIIRHCSVYCNPHITEQKKKMLEKIANDEEDGLKGFMLYGLPYDVQKKGYLFRHNLDLFEIVKPFDVDLYNLRIGLDFGKVDKSVMVVCADNQYDSNDIVILKIITLKNASINNFQKIAYLLDKYLEWARTTKWWTDCGFNIPIFFGTDNHYLEDILERTISDYNIPLKLHIKLVPKTAKGMLLAPRHLTLMSKLINGNLKCFDIIDIEPLILEMKATILEDDKITDMNGNDVKDAFFYANYIYFKWNSERKVDYNRTIPKKQYLKI